MNLVFLPYLLMLALLNSCIELEISAPSFPDIMEHFYVSELMVSATITYNLIGFCFASMIYGPLSEWYGRRRMMLIGNGVLMIGAIGCVIAPSMAWLLGSRFIQGIGAATSAVIVSAIIADTYATDKAARLYGFMNAVFTTLMALSPVMGGFITAAVGWRGNYGAVALICIVSWLLLFGFLPETKLTRKKTNVRKVIQDYKHLFSSLPFLKDASIPSILYGCYMAFVAIAPFVYMEGFKLNIFIYTFHQGAIVACFALISAVSGKVTQWLGVRDTIRMAMGLLSLGGVMLLLARTPFALTFAMSIFCMGSALLYPIVFARSLEIFPDMKGIASSAIMGLRYLLCSGIIGIVSYVYESLQY